MPSQIGLTPAKTVSLSIRFPYCKIFDRDAREKITKAAERKEENSNPELISRQFTEATSKVFNGGAGGKG